MKNLSAPLDVQFDITRKCQLDCSYCCASPLDGHHTNTRLARNLINELGDIGVISLLISGGEATLHPDFLSLLGQAANSVPMISFGTNGIRLSRGEFCSKIQEVAPRALITVSLDSLDPKAHNANRGHGAELAFRAIENCCQRNMIIGISCVLTENNIDNADGIVDKYYPDVKKFSFFPKVPRHSGEKFRNFNDFSNRLESIIFRLSQRRDLYPGLDLMLPYSPLSSSCVGTAFQSSAECSCFMSKSYITSDFNVYPCYYGASPQNLLGHYGDTSSFKKIWSGDRASEIRLRAAQGSLCNMAFGEDRVPTRFHNRVYSTVDQYK